MPTCILSDAASFCPDCTLSNEQAAIISGSILVFCNVYCSTPLGNNINKLRAGSCMPGMRACFKNESTSMVIAITFFTVAKAWIKHKCPLMYEW